MHTAERISWRTVILVAAAGLVASVAVIAQEGSGRETYQATAMGQGTQMGRLYSVNIILESYSSPEERQALIEAFNRGGNEAMVDVLTHMPSRGHIAITGTLGYDVKYARVFATPTGRKIRIVTDRPLRFGELRADSRSTDYSLSVLELDISSAKGQSGGVLLPACQFKISKEGELELEAYQNPWKLTNVMVR